MNWWQVVLVLLAAAIFAVTVIDALARLIVTLWNARLVSKEQRLRRRIDWLRAEQGRMPVRWLDYDDPLIDT